jgi:raffinose/stachyose/melibiose transport system substrate-binding protein
MQRRMKFLVPAVAATMAATSAGTIAATGTSEGAGGGEEVTLTMGSWRSDDVDQMETLLAALHEAHPNITVSFEPTINTEYNAALRTGLETGNAPDLFYLRSYAGGRALYDEGFISPLTDLGLDASFSEASLDPWTEDGVTYGLPFIATSHGFYYNADLLAEHGLDVPTTWDELLAVAAALDEAGITPFANASGDAWTMAELIWMNFAPSFIGGRDGRLAYESGERCLDDAGIVSVFQAAADLAPYLPDGQEALSYADSQQLWLLGEAAMWIGGSWDIPYFEGQEPDFEWSEFQVPTPEGGTKAVTFHLDAGMGINAATEHPDEAATVIEWLASDEAAGIMAAELPGFFPVQDEPPAIDDPHAANFLSWNADSETDVRFSWPVLSDGSPDAYTLIQDGTVGVVNGTTTPEEAAAALHDGVAEWYEPQQGCAA